MDVGKLTMLKDMASPLKDINTGERKLKSNKIVDDSKRLEYNIPCHVCGDRSSGRHYGVVSCDGCRGFFKRSVRRNSNYVCHDNLNCVIDLGRRNQCQCCRLRKCYVMGMRKEAVQHQRTPREKPSTSKTPADERDKETAPLVPSILTKESIVISSADILYDISVRILYDAITWTRNIPTFTELPFNDQALLLENCWSELFLLCLAIHNIPVDIDYLIEIGHRGSSGYNEVIYVDQALVKELCKVHNIIRKFNTVDLDSMEFACIKAIVVFKPDLEGLKSRDHVEHLQEQAQLTLLNHQKGSSKARFGYILLKLPLLGYVAKSLIKRYFFRGKLEVIKNESFVEILAENNDRDVERHQESVVQGSAKDIRKRKNTSPLQYLKKEFAEATAVKIKKE